jgi:hypothetical protein
MEPSGTDQDSPNGATIAVAMRPGLSPLLMLAQGEDHREARVMGAMSASLNAASASMQQSTAASWQNYNSIQQTSQLRNINNSIQDNTSAIRSLNSSPAYRPAPTYLRRY